MVPINNSNKTTTNNALALLCFLLCFLFLSNVYIQPDLATTHSVTESHNELASEDNPESSLLLSNIPYIKTLEQTNTLITYIPLENRRTHHLPCCNRGPPSLFYLLKATNTIS